LAQRKAPCGWVLQRRGLGLAPSLPAEVRLLAEPRGQLELLRQAERALPVEPQCPVE